ncbi:MAG: hypothetical protein K6E59_06165 [Bacilli bacterium]|nr:hypothetical protein [Bacilli bacterium]
MGNFFKKLFKPEEYKKEQQEKLEAKWRRKAAVFYVKAKPIVETYIDDKGYEGFAYRTYNVEGTEYYACGDWLDNQIGRIISEKFQMDTFGELVFDDDFDNGDGRKMENEPVLILLSRYPLEFGFCKTKFYLQNRNPYLKFLVAYHKVNPDIKINSDLIATVDSVFRQAAETFVYEKYGDDYYDKPGRLSEDERRDKAWADEELHGLLNELTDPRNPDNAAFFAENIDTPSLSLGLGAIGLNVADRTAEAILKYRDCKYKDRRSLFFRNDGSKKLLSASEIERKLDAKEK